MFSIHDIAPVVRLLKIIAAICVLALCLVAGGIGYALADDGTAINLAPVWGSLGEYIGAIAGGILLALIGWLSTIIKAKLGVDIDAKHREALHSALMTGVSAGLAKLEAKAPATIDVRSQLIAEGVSWAGTAAADAIKHFGLTPAGLETLAAAKVTQLLGTKTGAGS